MRIGFPLLVLVLLAGCGKSGNSEKDGSRTGGAEEAAARGPSPKAPARIVSVTPGITEMVYALGAGGSVVGVSDFDRYPPEVRMKPKVGAVQVSAEAVLALEPDLVVGDRDVSGKALEELQRLGLVVFALSEARTFSGIEENIRLLGRRLGRERAGDSLAGLWKERRRKVEEVTEALPPEKRPVVFLEHYPGLFTAGNGTFLHELLVKAGARNAAAGLAGWGQLGEESVLAARPDVILYPVTTAGEGSGAGASDSAFQRLIRGRGSWRHLPALQRNRIHGVDGDLLTRPGPRLYEGLEQVALLLHPGLFGARPAEPSP